METPSQNLEKNMQRYFKIFAIVVIAVVIWRGFFDTSKPLVQSGEANIVALDPKVIDEISNRVAEKIRLQNSGAGINSDKEVMDNSGEKFLDKTFPQVVNDDSGYYFFVPRVTFEENLSEINIKTEQIDVKIIKNSATINSKP